MGRGKHCTPEERTIILTLKNEGKSLRQIAKIVNCSKKMVENALKPQKIRQNLGQPRKTTAHEDRQIIRISKSDPFKSSKDIKSELGLNISARTVRRRLVQGNLHGRIARKVPLLNKRNITLRLKFAKDHLDWAGQEGSKKWRNILWTDETKINLFGNDGRQTVRRPTSQEFKPQYTKKTVKHGGGNIKLWGSFSWYGVGPLHLIDGNMDQNQFVNILKDTMLPYVEENMPLKWVLQQDNDPKHTSKLAKKLIADEKINLMEWPSQSPDLNPIEHLWGDLKRAVGKYNTRNKAELWQIIQREWAAIPLDQCRNLVESMPRRCQEVIKNKGQATKY